MSRPTITSLKEKTERLIDVEPYNTVRINLILGKALDELNLVITNETTIFNNIRKEILNYREKLNPKRLKDVLDKSEMNALEIKLNAVIEILENKKNIKNIIDYINESKSGLLNLHRRYGFAYRESINKSLKEIRKEPKKH